MVKRLVVVSNRLPPPPAMAGLRDAPVGGLASAVHAALRRAPGSLWFGWNGEQAAHARRDELTTRTLDGVGTVGMPLTASEIGGYYRGFCNGALWPLFHGFQGRVKLEEEEEAAYRAVNARFAAALRPLLEPHDQVWVHDYHLICLARELRRNGWRGRIGFFLHIPFPARELWLVLPRPREFLEALLEYDLVGFQTRTSLDNYVSCARRELGADWMEGCLAAGDRRQAACVYPIGIDPAEFLPAAGGRRPDERAGVLSRVVRGRRLILGVDRLDYTKGIPERILAFEQFIKRYPEWRKRVSFVQVASPSRSQVAEYVEQKRRVEALVGRINGELAEHDWVPLRYLYRSYRPAALARFYLESHVGLVTPLRDGMNLVAKEFVAAQDPADPGVLVLSRFAGAAEQLTEAVLVNPFMPTDVAAGIARAMAMPLPERRERHRVLLARVLEYTASDWANRFLADLSGLAGAGAGDG